MSMTCSRPPRSSFVGINKPDPFNNYRPFFLYLAYTIPHANNEEGQRTGNGMEVPSDIPYSDQPWPPVEKNKAAMITRLDGYVGQLLDKLKELKIDESTIVFFTSDNGPHKEGGVDPKFFQSSGPLRGIKRDLYEGGIRVPLIVRWPGKIKPGKVNDQAWAFWDFLPTAAEVADAKVPPKLDGMSMLPALLGQAQTNGHEFLYWEFHERGFQQAVRMGDWKAVRPQAGAPLELYNLSTDLGEKQNVAGQNPEVVAKIEEYLKGARTESEHWPIKPASPLPAGEADKKVATRSDRGAGAFRSRMRRVRCDFLAHPQHGQRNRQQNCRRARTTATCNVACFRGPAGCPYRSSCSSHRMQPVPRSETTQFSVFAAHPPCIPRWRWQVSAYLNDCDLSKAWWIFNEPGSVTI